MIFLRDLKSKSTSDFFGPCYLGKKCKNQNWMLVGLNGVCCETCSLPIQQQKNNIGIDDQRSILLLSWLSFWWKDDWWWLSLQVCNFFFNENEEFFFFFKLTILLKKYLLNFFKLFWVQHFHLHKTTILK